MDERGRVPLPPVYRDAFRDGVVLSQGSPDLCLRVFTTGAFNEQASEYTVESAMHEKGRALRLALFSRTRMVELDKQNRILIPGPMREYAALAGKVLVAGAGEYLEIWSPERFEEQMTRVDAQLAATLESTEPRRA